MTRRSYPRPSEPIDARVDGQDIRQYGWATSITVKAGAWGGFIRANALCSDGIVRRTSRLSESADTFFSIPAAVKVNGKSVSGYVTTESLAGLSTESEGDPAAVKFVAYMDGKNADLLPAGAYHFPESETAS